MTEQNPQEKAEPAASDVDAVVERVSTAALGMQEMLALYLGDRLGWYRELARGPRSAAELATATDTDERYAREWLEQQAVAGYLEADEGDPRRFTLPPATAEVLTDADSLSYLAPMARVLTASAVRIPELLDAYRTGGGVGWAAFDADMREGQADSNRPWFLKRLGSSLGSVPELASTLSRPGARIAEIGFGGGWASIALARAFPDARIDGFDVDAASVELARANAAEAGLADRIAFHHSDGANLDGEFDTIFAFECVHDMPQPVPVLAAARAALAPGGVMVVMDEGVADEFTAPGDEYERMTYGFSLLVCLPDGRSHSPSEATGTVMRRSTLEGYARRAGFDRVDVLPIDDFAAFRFYALRPA